MKTNLICITLFLIFPNCTGTPTESNESSFVSECLESEDVKFINSIVELFEKQLTNKYGAKSYKQFLFEMKSMSIPPDFFVKSDLTKFLLKNKTSSMFKKIWIEQGDSFSLNSNGKYHQCLKEKSDSKTLTEVLETIEKVPNISPGLIASALEAELTDEEYTLESVKTYLAVNIYSEFAINIYDKFDK